MSKLFLDTETCGLVGFPVLIQYAYDDGDITLYSLWQKPVSETLALIEEFMRHDFIGFNLSFDHFHLSKCYNVFKKYVEKYPGLANVAPQIKLVVECEEDGMDGVSLKPSRACDLMLHCRKDQRTQTLMSRGDIRIRKVPMELAYPLADELDARLELPEVYWTRQQDKTLRWRVYDIEEEPYFKDVVLKFNASGALKSVLKYFVGLEPPFAFGDIACQYYPEEVEYAPSARAVYEHHGVHTPAWPDVVHHHIEHWATDANAREYARFDVHGTRELYKWLGSPEPGDDDSELACMVATVRWHGFTIDIPAIEVLQDLARTAVAASPINVNSSDQVRTYLSGAMDPTEQILIHASTRMQILDEIAKWKDNDEAASRAKTIINVRKAQKEIELFGKLILARRLHADFKVIGTLSSRMSGGGGLNVQGIKGTEDVRRCFPLKWDGMVLSGGDFSKFEMTIADATYKDESFRQLIVGDLKPAGVFGELMYPHLTYDEILASEGKDPDYYTSAKGGLFATLYFGEAFTLHTNQGIPMDVAERAITEWRNRTPGLKASIARITEANTAIVENGQGGFAWVDPQPFAINLQGYRRSFELEITVMRILFDLAVNPPKEWNKKKIKVVRRQKIQTAAGAVRSALYGAAFSIQNANIRASGNHEVQSTGALICKTMQRKIWDIQPCGIGPFLVMPMNIHDEIQCVCQPDTADRVEGVVGEVVGTLRKSLVPLLGMDWYGGLPSWNMKDHVGDVVKFKPSEEDKRRFEPLEAYGS